MRKFSTTGRLALVGVAALLLSACSSTSDQEIAETFADQRADVLSQIVPVNMNGYNLVRAKANGSQIELTLLYAESGDVAPAALVDKLKKSYCTDNEIHSLLDKGVSYKLLIRDSRGRPVFDRVISATDCEE